MHYVLVRQMLIYMPNTFNNVHTFNSVNIDILFLYKIVPNLIPIWLQPELMVGLLIFSQISRKGMVFFKKYKPRLYLKIVAISLKICKIGIFEVSLISFSNLQLNLRRSFLLVIRIDLPKSSKDYGQINISLLSSQIMEYVWRQVLRQIQ